MRRILAVLLLAASACSSTPAAKPAGTPSPGPSTASPAPSPSPSPAEPRFFDADRAMRTIQALAVGIGPREDTDARYGLAVDLIAGAFAALGYDVRRHEVPIPSGRSVRVPVPAGTTTNVIGSPRGFDASKPYLLAGAHLDTVVGSPGANDNASGVAVIMEVARLARLLGTAMPVRFVAFGGEERRREGADGTLYGSRAYVASMSGAERANLRGVIVLDVVGKGSRISVTHSGTPRRAMVAATLAAAKRAGIDARERVESGLFSDHVAFEKRGIPVAWLWSGDFAELHTNDDTPAIVQRTMIEQAGRLTWEALRSIRL